MTGADLADRADPADRADRTVVITGLGVTSAFGRGEEALGRGLAASRAAFGPVGRFATDRYRTGVAAVLPGSPDLDEELRRVVEEACEQAGLSAAERAQAPLLLGRHADPAVARGPLAVQGKSAISDTAAALARACGLLGAARTYTNACVAASTAVSEAAVRIRTGREDRVVVSAGYLVDEDNFALFSAGRALSPEGVLRSFSSGRKGLLLGDGVGAVVLESASAAAARGARPLAVLSGWGLAGDAHHVCRPHPEGQGMARAIGAALDRAGLTPADIGYVNAHGTGTPANDSSESSALRLALGDAVDGIPVSSTKSLHGHSLEASGMLELAVTLLVLRSGELPVNAGHLGPDDDCRLDLVLGSPRRVSPRHVLSLNAAFGGANTALVVSAP
ncbi:beta-ketoacyl synthase N-terminal-like domain-containing protein [Streptomyces sp. ZAF1911]|uniref:beta-ketoacyl-[acyl-carrier-protein] synthase family protein n=1 Tax=Streptomyces sp. ZAF1911 TaxID=2944129 RepID=UPI00237ADD18|nr:beta-ketoacyl synthase N-terminal-like domain-containing protein [Streptomyces sp. ZAF1911]MDD9382931.1 beta-ketoacyl synthase N-terminal-like domain-containing protein [Streptomyces sp. ZAF1911]